MCRSRRTGRISSVLDHPKIDVPSPREGCPQILRTEPTTNPQTTHCFCVFHPKQKDHSTPKCEEKKSPNCIAKAWELCARETICVSCLTKGHETRECPPETRSPICPNCKINHTKVLLCRPTPEEIYDWFCVFHPDASDHRTPECLKWNEENNRTADENRRNWEALGESYSCKGCLLRGHVIYDCPTLPPTCSKCQVPHASVLLCAPPSPRLDLGLSRPSKRKSKSSSNNRRRY